MFDSVAKGRAKGRDRRACVISWPLLRLQCNFIMRMHMVNPLTTRELSAQKLEDTPDSGPADASGESSERWLTLSVRTPPAAFPAAVAPPREAAWHTHHALGSGCPS
jgi:hypothetical protein